MSIEPDRIRASVQLADFVNIDGTGKINIIGGGISLIGMKGPSTEPFGLYTRLTSDLPIKDGPAVEVLLADASGNPVELPSGPNGEMTVMRVAQNVEFTPPAVPGVFIPNGAIPSTSHIVLYFAGGLPLKPGHSYTWRVQIDHDVVASESFYIPTPPTTPVIG